MIFFAFFNVIYFLYSPIAISSDFKYRNIALFKNKSKKFSRLSDKSYKSEKNFKIKLYNPGLSSDIKNKNFAISTPFYEDLVDIDIKVITKQNLSIFKSFFKDADVEKKFIVGLRSDVVPIFREYLLADVKNPIVLLLRTSFTDATFPKELYPDDLYSSVSSDGNVFYWDEVILKRYGIINEDPIKLNELCSTKNECEKRKDFEFVLDNKYVKHAYAINLDYPNHPKVSHLPIGISYHYKHNRNSLYDYTHLQFLDTNKRRKKIFYEGSSASLKTYNPTRIAYHKNQGYKSREDILKLLQNDKKKDFVYIEYDRLQGEKYWKTKGRYAFTISPIGMGLDCFRTFESIFLGQIVIVEKSPLDKMYEGLPVVIVDNYNDITAADLDRWLKMYPDVMSNKKYQEKLKRGYWESLIKSHFYS